jgi:uncharacterized membrane-anchored protein YhcB (DUF1043 family)
MPRKNIASLMREHKTLIIIIAVVLFLLELEIFALAAMKSGRKSWLQVVNAQGSVIHEADGGNLSQFNKYYFEKTFGPLEQYHFKLVTKEIPFPFRAWFVAAVGIPVGVILLFGFAVQAFRTLFYGQAQEDEKTELPKAEYEHRIEKIIAGISRFNIFTIGFMVLLAVFCYWVIPNLIVYSGQLGIETLTRYKWIFLSIGIVFMGLIVWIIYLRYLLAKKTIESQTEIDKHRLQLEYNQSQPSRLQLEYDRKEKPDQPKVNWEKVGENR